MALNNASNANEEDLSLQTKKTHATTYVPARLVLGDLSPNATSLPVTAGKVNSKPLAGSPLKRSFNAAIESGVGLTYLKKRKLSEGDTLSARRKTKELEEDKAQNLTRLEISEAGNADMSAITINSPTPTEPNTPSDEGRGTQNISIDKKSFSSLINYDPSSQPNNASSQFVSSAEMLQLRLRVAMYKVRTNQIATPFAKLRVESKPRPISTSEAVEEAVASLRREAQGPPTSHHLPSYPKLLPAPVLRPTAYSSRTVCQSPVSSSPTTSESPNRLPVQSPLSGTPHQPRQTFNSPSKSAQKLGELLEQDLTSSAVKGKVAEGLLGLRNAT